MIKRLIFLSLILFSQQLFAQTFTQTVRGTIRDKDSQAPLIGVNVIIQGTSPMLGTVSEVDGSFKIANVPIGQYNIVFSYIGYESMALPNVTISSGKEVVLTVDLIESVITLDEAVITPEDKMNRGQAQNEFSTVSSRTFSIEESSKYAGTFNDPSRMVTTFAGVVGGGGADDVDNEIIIRGNSPKGLLWKVEGVEVPSPSHFTDQGASSGSVSILSSNMLANSDFSTGAFAAEYGNALSGVFDIKLRKGNNQKREYAFRAGVLGLEAAVEGPFKKGGKASYLANYRYSTLALLNNLGIKLVGNALPIFQDLSFKVYLPTKKAGYFSIFGIGGSSNINEYEEGKRPDGTTVRVKNEKFGYDLGIIGLTHNVNFSEKTYAESTVSFSAAKTDFRRDVPTPSTPNLLVNNESFKDYTGRASFMLNHKFNAKHLVRAGVIYSYLGYDLLSQAYNGKAGSLVDEINENGNTGVVQGYGTWRFRINERLSVNAGLHYMNFLLNQQSSIEPRAALKWALNEKQSISAGFGIHSRREGLAIYLSKQAVNGNMVQSNRNLDFSKARHYVLGYDNYITRNLHFRAEVYYQDLYNVPVKDSTGFSILNTTKGFTPYSLVNKGTGENYGVELTLEKFLSNNYYFTTNVSLFESKYVGGDGIKRNTLYNANYVVNLLVGKDFIIGTNRKFNLNLRGVMAGGQRFIPIDLAKSIQSGYEVGIVDQAYQNRLKDYFRTDFQASYTINKPKSTFEIRLEIQNVTDRANVRDITYVDNPPSGVPAIVENKRGQLLPVLSVQVKF
ncbi:MAG: TonB-dependent receptor [Bacteroidota bacterium]